MDRNISLVNDWRALLETPAGQVDVSEMWKAFFPKARANSQLCAEFYGFLDSPFRDYVKITGISDGEAVEFCPIRLDYAAKLGESIEDAVILSSATGALYVLEGAYIKNAQLTT